MKKFFCFTTLLLIMLSFSVASAEANESHYTWSRHVYKNDYWQQIATPEKLPPFKWYERADFYLSTYHMQLILKDKGAWKSHFPDLTAYLWHGSFLYLGSNITDAVMFYNDLSELIALAFWHNGVFTFMRNDDKYFENNDPSLSALLNTVIKSK